MMRAKILLALAAAAGLALWACGGGSSTCTNLVHTACDMDAGNSCPTHQSCIDSSQAVDPCDGDAGGCCFQVCTQSSDCPSGLSCVSGSCVQGRCVQ